MTETRTPLPEGYWKHVHKEPGPCWLWGKGRTSGKFAGRHAHRMMFEHVYGAIPAGRQVGRTCASATCVRPEHLTPALIGDMAREVANAAKTLRSTSMTSYLASRKAATLKDLGNLQAIFDNAASETANRLGVSSESTSARIAAHAAARAVIREARLHGHRIPASAVKGVAPGDPYKSRAA